MKLGVKVKDKITGFEGIAIGHCEYISGCHQTLVAPPVDKKGCARDSRWFDDQRLEVTNDKAIVLENGETPGCDIPAPIL